MQWADRFNSIDNCKIGGKQLGIISLIKTYYYSKFVPLMSLILSKIYPIENGNNLITLNDNILYCVHSLDDCYKVAYIDLKDYKKHRDKLLIYELLIHKDVLMYKTCDQMVSALNSSSGYNMSNLLGLLNLVFTGVKYSNVEIGDEASFGFAIISDYNTKHKDIHLVMIDKGYKQGLSELSPDELHKLAPVKEVAIHRISVLSNAESVAIINESVKENEDICEAVREFKDELLEKKLIFSKRIESNLNFLETVGYRDFTIDDEIKAFAEKFNKDENESITLLEMMTNPNTTEDEFKELANTFKVSKGDN